MKSSVNITSKKDNHFKGQSASLVLGITEFAEFSEDTENKMWHLIWIYVYVLLLTNIFSYQNVTYIHIKRSYLESCRTADSDNETINWSSHQTVNIYVEYIHYFNVFGRKMHLWTWQMYVILLHKPNSHIPHKKDKKWSRKKRTTKWGRLVRNMWTYCIGTTGELMEIRQCVWYLTVRIHVYSLVQMHF